MTTWCHMSSRSNDQDRTHFMWCLFFFCDGIRYLLHMFTMGIFQFRFASVCISWFFEGCPALQSFLCYWFLAVSSGFFSFLFGYLLHSSSYPLRDYRRRMLQSEMYLQLFSFFGFSNPLLFFSAMFPIGALFLLVPMQSVLDFNDSSNCSWHCDVACIILTKRLCAPFRIREWPKEQAKRMANIPIICFRELNMVFNIIRSFWIRHFSFSCDSWSPTLI